MAALVELKHSDNAQFRDPAGACKLMQTADIGGDWTWRSRLEASRGA